MEPDSEKKSGEFLKNNDKTDRRFSVFELSGVIFGIEILIVKEIIPIPNITHIPNVEPYILGVFNIRSIITTLIDIRYILGLKIFSIQNDNMILLIENGSARFGILIDKVLDIINIQESVIKPVHENIAVQNLQYISGIYENKNLGNIYLIDIQKIKEYISRT